MKKKVKWQGGTQVNFLSWQVCTCLPMDLKVHLTPMTSYISSETNSHVAHLPSKNLLSQLFRKSAAFHFSYLKPKSMQTVTSVQINYSNLLTCKVNTYSTAAIYDTENQCNSLLLILAYETVMNISLNTCYEVSSFL